MCITQQIAHCVAADCMHTTWRCAHNMVVCTQQSHLVTVAAMFIASLCCLMFICSALLITYYFIVIFSLSSSQSLTFLPFAFHICLRSIIHSFSSYYLYFNSIILTWSLTHSLIHSLVQCAH